MFKRGNSIRVRLTAATSILFAFALALSAWGLVKQVESALLNEAKTRNDFVAKALGQAMLDEQAIAWSSDTAIVNRMPDTYDREVLQAGIDESVVFVEGPGAVAVTQSPSILDRLRQLVTGERTPLFGKTIPKEIDDDRYVVSTLDVVTPDGPVRLTVASSTATIAATVKEVRDSMLIAVPAMVVAVALFSWLLVGRVLSPIASMNERVKEITGSTLDQRVPEPNTDDEIARLARTMNEMLERLQNASASQKRFMSDASHELRSPVASIKTQIETALIDPDNTNWVDVGNTVLGEDERIGALVDNLLALTKIEEGLQRSRADVDLDEIVYELGRRPYRVDVGLSGISAGRVCGNADELGSVARNLLDNANRHATSKIEVSLCTIDDIVRLIVDDDGPGIPESRREVIFERFARLQEGRSRDAGGSGLGLALTKRIVESMNGTIDVEQSPLGGARFVVTLPASY